jgi:hypothetical protein
MVCAVFTAAGTVQSSECTAGVRGWRPWFKKKGVSPVEALTELIANSAMGGRAAWAAWAMGSIPIGLGGINIYCRMVSSNTRFMRLVSPSVWGWYADERSRRVSRNAAAP